EPSQGGCHFLTFPTHRPLMRGIFSNATHDRNATFATKGFEPCSASEPRHVGKSPPCPTPLPLICAADLKTVGHPARSGRGRASSILRDGRGARGWNEAGRRAGLVPASLQRRRRWGAAGPGC